VGVSSAQGVKGYGKGKEVSEEETRGEEEENREEEIARRSIR
jgi:hypothetical protein